MKIGIIGSGGREHSIGDKIKNSNFVKKIFFFPGNGGTHSLGENIEVDINDFERLKEIILLKKIDLVIVGPEKPLVDGLVNYLEKFNINTFGPNKIASQLEGSKIFTKKLCKKYKIPTANFGIFNNKDDAKIFIQKLKFPVVIKADSLASGKGVYICENVSDSTVAINEILNGKFGKTNTVLIEEYLVGEEMSFFTIHDGKTFKVFGTAQDHKRVNEGDKGKNTGGMGAYSPSRLASHKLEKKIIDKIILPTMKGLSDLGVTYKGFLYTGLMVINDEPYLIEYNVRMGDPECQTILPTLKTDLLKIIMHCINGTLEECSLNWHDTKSICIVLCSKGYPDKFEKNIPLKNLNKISNNENNFLYHAGTTLIGNQIYSEGGRVLNFVSLSKNLYSGRKEILDKIEKLDWSNGFFRRDIGFKVIDQ